METFEVRSKSFTVKWLNLPSNSEVNWTIKPLKNSINLGIYKVNQDIGGLPMAITPPMSSEARGRPNLRDGNFSADSVNTVDVDQSPRKIMNNERSNSSSSYLQPPLSNSRKSLDHVNMTLPTTASSTSVLSTNTTTRSKTRSRSDTIGSASACSILDDKLDKNLIKKYWIGRCVADELQSGSFRSIEGGQYAFIFDNTFSKTKSKKIKFSFNCSDVLNTVDSSDDNKNKMTKPTTRVTFEPPSTINQKKLNDGTSCVKVNGVQYLQGYLMKRKRKKAGKTFNKRFFSLNLNYGILDYYINENSRNIRGNMLISQSVISADSKELLLNLDSGMEQWILKAYKKEDFNLWVQAFNSIKEKNSENNDSNFDILSTGNESSFRNSRRWNPNPYFAEVEEKISLIKELTDEALDNYKFDNKPFLLKQSNLSISSRSPSTCSVKDFQPSSQQEQPASLSRKSSFFSKLKRKQGNSHSTKSNENEFTESNSSRNGSESPIIRPRDEFSNQLNEIKNHVDELEELYHLLRMDEDVQYSRSRSESRKTLTRTTSLSGKSSLYSQEFFDAQEFIDKIDNGVVMLNDGDEIDLMEPKLETFNPVNNTSSEEEDEEEDIEESKKEDEINVSDLSPLPFDKPYEYRKDIKPSACDPPSIMSILRKGIGKDLTNLAMPLTTNEPLSFLQRYCEAFEYSDLINESIQMNEHERILRVGIFAISYLSSYRDKVRSLRKAFNPLLGETFELIRPEMGIRVICEKVIHKPFVMATHAESKHWILDHNLLPQQNFYGKSADLIMLGKVKLIVSETGEIFEWNQPNTAMRNMISLTSDKYVEPFDSITIKSNNGLKCIVKFLPETSRFSSSRSEKVEIKIYDKGNKAMKDVSASGSWTEKIIDNKGNHIWSARDLVKNHEKKWGFTVFNCELNNIDEVHELCSPTDSRRRPDQKLYEDGQIDRAEKLKGKLEEDQRIRRKDCNGNDVVHKAKFFKNEDSSDNLDWKFVQGEKSYWNRRIVNDWDDLVKLW